MLVGHLPFQGANEHEVVRQIVNGEPIGVRRTRPEVPAELAEVLPRALAKSPVDRYPSAADFRDEAMVVVPDPEACADALSAMMDSLFPEGTDAERTRLQAIVPEEAMPADASSPLRRLMGWLRK